MSFTHLNWTNDLGHIASRFAAYRSLMRHWERVLPVPVLQVDYEEIVADFESSARAIVGWCGLEWEPACLAFHEAKRVVRTASFVQVRQPIYRRSVERWRNYEEELGSLFELLDNFIASPLPCGPPYDTGPDGRFPPLIQPQPSPRLVAPSD
jgi:hypothetical protein